MDRVQLKGGLVHLTNDSEQAYRVLDGHVLVYIVPYVDKNVGRRFLIYEAEAGDMIPSLKVEHDENGSWRFALVALEQASLEVLIPEDMESIKMDFAKMAGIFLFSPEEFEEEVVEQYDINIVKEEGYIYATSQEQEQTYETYYYWYSWAH